MDAWFGDWADDGAEACNPGGWALGDWKRYKELMK